MQEQSGKYLFGITDRSVPPSQACSHESPTGEYMMAGILRRGDCCGQYCFRVRELIVLPQFEDIILYLDVWFLESGVETR